MIIKKIKPMFQSVITTKERYAIDDVPKGVLIDPRKVQGALKEFQTVVAVGSMVRDVKVGDLVKINPKDYAVYEDYKPGDGMRQEIAGKKKQLIGYDIPTVEIDEVEHLFIQERDIEYVVEEWEEEQPQSDLIIPDKSIIMT